MPGLFEHTRIKNMELKNRFVRSATHEGMSDERGYPTQSLFRLYEKLARGGVGLIITGYASVSPEGKSPFLRMQVIDSDEYIPRYQEMVKHVHGHGARIVMQIAHCGRQTTPEAIGMQPIAPSAVKEQSLFVRPREMSEDDIERVIESFAQAARRVRLSGFDGVQLHGAHGYLINQFLCPHTNRRRDRWGGSLENRMRFVSELYLRCREQIGDSYPLLIKINATDGMRKGLRLSESIDMAVMMAEMGFDGIEVSCGIMEDNYTQMRGDLPVEAVLQEWEMYRKKNPVYRFMMRHFGKYIVRPLPITEAYNREAARTIKQRVSVPVFLVGGITDPAVMDDIIESGDADYISLCRALINDPAFPAKIRAGKREKSRCIHCNLCIGYLATKPLRCYHGKMPGTGKN